MPAPDAPAPAADEYRPAVFVPADAGEDSIVSSADGTPWHEFAAKPENAAKVRSAEAKPMRRVAFKG